MIYSVEGSVNSITEKLKSQVVGFGASYFADLSGCFDTTVLVNGSTT